MGAEEGEDCRISQELFGMHSHVKAGSAIIQDNKSSTDQYDVLAICCDADSYADLVQHQTPLYSLCARAQPSIMLLNET